MRCAKHHDHAPILIKDECLSHITQIKQISKRVNDALDEAKPKIKFYKPLLDYLSPEGENLTGLTKDFMSLSALQSTLAKMVEKAIDYQSMNKLVELEAMMPRFLEMDI